MFEHKDVVQRTLAQAAVVVTDKSALHLDRLSGQSSLCVVVKQTRGSGHDPLKAVTSKEKKETKDVNVETNKSIAW